MNKTRNRVMANRVLFGMSLPSTDNVLSFGFHSAMCLAQEQMPGNENEQGTPRNWWNYARASEMLKRILCDSAAREHIRALKRARKAAAEYRSGGACETAGYSHAAGYPN